MKKADIILTFNNLQVELQTVADHYQAVTGETHPKVDEGVLKNLGWHAENWGKDYLHDLLNLRQRLIRTIPADEENFINTKKMKESAEGQMFIKGLEDAKMKKEEELKGISDTFHKSFEDLLSSFDMGEWKLNPNHDVFPSFRHEYITIYNDLDQWCNMRVTINKSDRGWEFTPSVSLYSTSNDVSNPGTQYLQCKAYVTLFHHADEIHTWLEDTYAPLASRVYDLNLEIERLKDQLSDPYTAWVESK